MTTTDRDTRVRETLRDLADDLFAEIDARYPGNMRNYPTMSLKYKQDMGVVDRARALLAELDAIEDKPEAMPNERLQQLNIHCRAFFDKHGMPSLAQASCFACGQVGEPSTRHSELPNVYICAACITKLRPDKPEGSAPVGWLYEDELPRNYPYDEMFQYSAIIEGIRTFPVYAPQPPPVPQGDDAVPAWAWRKAFETGDWSDCDVDNFECRARELAREAKS
jgi:hypothetical protein